MAGQQPKYKGDGVAVWMHTDRNGKPYLSIQLVGHSSVLAFENTPKPKDGPKTGPRVSHSVIR